MRDIDYAFLSQMSYLNWENLTKKKMKESACGDFVTNIVNEKELWNILSPTTNLKKKEINEYEGNDKRLFMNYKIEENKKPVFDFSNWKFLLGVDYGGIYKLYFKKKKKTSTSRYKNSFRGVVFKNGNEIVIAFNGIEKLVTMKKNVITIDDMKMYNKNYSPLLAGYWLYQYVKENYAKEGDEIYLTGNKYGGFIAQYVYMATGGENETVLWNPIGSGINSEIRNKNEPPRALSDLRNTLGYPEMSKEVAEKIYSQFVLENGWISPEILKPDAKQKIIKIFEEESKNEKEIPKEYIKDKDEPEESSTRREEHIEALYYIFLTTYLYNDDYTNKISNEMMYTYFVEGEWAIHAINRIGVIIDISTGIKKKERKIRRTPLPIYELPFPTEELNDVIMFMNNRGNLRYGTLREEFAKNSIKSVIRAQLDVLENDNIIIRNKKALEIKRETLEEFNIKYYTAGVLTNGKKFGFERKLDSKTFRYKEIMIEGILSLKKPYNIVFSEENKEYIELGKQVNVKSLGDIRGGQTLRIEIVE